MVSCFSGARIARIGGLPWPKTGTTYYHAQLELPDKVCAIKGLVVYMTYRTHIDAFY